MIAWWWIPASFGIMLLLFLATVGLGAMFFGLRQSLAERRSKQAVVTQQFLKGPGEFTVHQGSKGKTDDKA